MWLSPQETTDLHIFTEEIPNGKEIHFPCSDRKALESNKPSFPIFTVI